MLEYVMEDVAKHRRKGDLQSATEDKAGVIIFGREATIEYPAVRRRYSAVGTGQLDSLFQMRTDATNIASALKLAQASFPGRHGQANRHRHRRQRKPRRCQTIASTLAENGIGIDVVPIRLNATAEVAVEKIALPPDIRRGQPNCRPASCSKTTPQPTQGEPNRRSERASCKVTRSVWRPAGAARAENASRR